MIRAKGSLLPASDTGLCRVCVHWGTVVVDLVLPAGVPVAALIPSIVDALEIGHPNTEAVGYQLSVPGASALDPSTTLAHNRIGDGAVLVLSRSTPPPPAPRYFDDAQAVSAALAAAARSRGVDGNRRAARLAGASAAALLTAVGGLVLIRKTASTNLSHDVATTVAVLASAGLVALASAALAHRAYRDPVAGQALSVIATALAAVAGFVAVPGAPTVSNVLLAATAAAVTAVSAMRLSGHGAVALTALACFAVVAAVAALMGVITAAPLHVIASVAGAVSLGLLGVAARVSIALAGLSPRVDSPDLTGPGASGSSVAANAVRADRWLASLLAGLASSGGAGAVVTVLAGAPRPSCVAFGTLTGALLLLRCRSGDGARMLAFAVSGIAATATTFGVAALRAPMDGPSVAAATAALVAAAMYLGFAADTSSPVVRRGVELLEWLALTALVPLTCWICGLYGAVRGLSFT